MRKAYEGRYKTLEGALKIAQKIAFDDINSTPGRKTDFLMTRVVDWGFRYGGFTQEENFYVKVEEATNKDDSLSMAEGGFDNGNA